MNRTLLKLEGRETIKGRLNKSIFFTFSRALISMAIGYISGFSVNFSDKNPKLRISVLVAVIFLSVIYCVSLSVFRMLEEIWYIGQSHVGKKTFRKLVAATDGKRFFKGVLLSFVIGLRKLIWIFLLSLPGCAIIYLSVRFVLQKSEYDIFLIMLTGGVLLVIFGLFFAFCINQRYFMAKYLFLKNPKISIKRAVRVGIAMMDGNCLKTAVFKMSFLPHLLSCVFVLPVIYALPYFRQSCTCLKREISGLFFSRIKSEQK